MDLHRPCLYNISMPLSKTRRLAVLGERQINLNGRNITYTLKQSRRIRGIRLEIRAGSGLTVVVPVNYKYDQIQQILDEKTSWILKHLPAGRPRQIPLFKKEVDHGEKIPYLGQDVRVIISSGPDNTAGVELKGQSIYIHMKARQKSIARVLEKWYRMQAEVIFRQKAQKFSVFMDLRYKEILIRGQKTRWGSCSHTGNLTLNWKLMLAPEPVIDYVIMHELAHLKHMNHSRRFWEYLSRFCPQWRQHRQWLSKHEHDLNTSATFGLQ